MSSDPYVIDRVKWATLSPAGRVELEEVYTSSFPVEERADFDQLGRHSETLWVVSEPGAQIVGFATVVFLLRLRVLCQVEYSFDMASKHVVDLVSGVRC